MPRLSARLHLLGLIAAALVPVWLFATFLLAQYAVKERDRLGREAMQVARQVSLVVDGELRSLLAVLETLSTSSALTSGDLRAVHAEAVRLVRGTDRIIVLRDYERRQLLNTQLPYGAELPPAVPVTQYERQRLEAGRPVVGEVYASPVSGEYRIPVAAPVKGPAGENWILALTVPTDRIRDAMAPAVPAQWTLGIGDRDGTYVARSALHDEATGRPGLPEYLKQAVGRAGNFTSRSLQGVDLLAGYYRSDLSDWLYGANIPIAVAQNPLWETISAISALAFLAAIISAGLIYVVGKNFTEAASQLAARADSLGRGLPIEPLRTSVSEFAAIADALLDAQRRLAERSREMEAVLETVPAAVWFTYDPTARLVIRNRFAADLMGLETDTRKSFGAPDSVIDTIALKDGTAVSRDDRPLSRAMRGEHTDHQEFDYLLPNGHKVVLLTSARPILDAAGDIVGAVQISLDITERKRGEEQRRLLVNELNHRVKNTLAIVQSIASQTMRGAKDLREANSAIAGRLGSLARAHDMLTVSNWGGADLRTLVAASVTPQAGIERFVLTGPDVWLPAEMSLSLALALHELATNAIKYGALSAAGGQVAVSWTVTNSAERHLRVEWREAGGPATELPQRQGFGMRLLSKVLESVPGGQVDIQFKEAGLVCVLEVDLGPAAA